MIEKATNADGEAIADLNVRAYAEFAPLLAPGVWEGMQKNLTNIAERARSAQFLVIRGEGKVIGSVGYGPAGAVIRNSSRPGWPRWFCWRWRPSIGARVWPGS